MYLQLRTALDKIIEDKELGRLIVRDNVRAKRSVFHIKADTIYVSIPPGATMKEVKEAIEKLRSRLLDPRQKLICPLIDLNYRIETEYFKSSLVSGKREKFLAHSELGEMRIICPPMADFADSNLQDWLRKVIEEALRRDAKIILPPWLYMFSERYGLPCRNVQVNSGRGQWGSCPSHKKINLSYSLVLLPKHLIDYVLLHEPCHIREINHGDRFWDLLNGFTGGKTLELCEELKEYKTEI